MVLWCRRHHQIPNPFLEVHGMAAKAIVHQVLLLVVRNIQENFFESHCMRPGRPVRILLLVTGSTAARNALHIV
jgi:hypothetical protein